MQIVVAVQSESDCGAAEYGNEGERDLEAGDGVRRARFAIAAPRQQVEQQPEQRHDEQGGRHRTEDAETLRTRATGELNILYIL